MVRIQQGMKMTFFGHTWEIHEFFKFYARAYIWYLRIDLIK